MNYKVIETETFTDLYRNLDEDEKNWLKKIIQQLNQNPFVGKPLKSDWFREKKYQNKRLYYLVYSKMNVVVLVAFAGKKEQTEIIAHILLNLKDYESITKSVNEPPS